MILGLIVSVASVRIPLPDDSDNTDDTPVGDTTVKTTYYPVSTVLDNVTLV